MYLLPIGVKRSFSGKNKCRTGLDFISQELTGWLPFAIGRFHVSDRKLFHPQANKHFNKEILLEEEGEIILIKDYEGT